MRGLGAIDWVHEPIDLVSDIALLNVAGTKTQIRCINLAVTFSHTSEIA